jgi:hypothetical protein
MRLLASSLILVITALDFAFGQPGTALHVAGLVAGILVALTVVIDRLWPPPAAKSEQAPRPTPEQV